MSNQKLLIIFLFLSICFLFLTYDFYNIVYISDLNPGHTYLNRGYIFPFTGVSNENLDYRFIKIGEVTKIPDYKKVLYLPNLIVNLTLLTFIFNIMNYFFRLKTKHKNFMYTEPNFKIVGVYKSRLEAEISKSKLNSNNIKSHISADDAGGMYPELFKPKFGVQLVVKSIDFVKAKNILKI